MRKPAKIVPIILAAGPSPGLPFPKALAPFSGKTALSLAVTNCVSLAPPIVVLGCNARQILPKVPANVRAVINRKWRDGQLGSLQRALKSIPPDVAFLIYPVDHVLLKRATILRLAHAFHTRLAGQDIVMPRHCGVDGHPVIVSAVVRAEFFQAPTAREVIYRVPDRIRAVEVKSSAIFEDFNSLETYNHCRQTFRRRNSSKGEG